MACTSYFLPFFGFSTCATLMLLAVSALRTTRSRSARPERRLRRSAGGCPASTRSTFRLWIVTRPPPIRPAARMPLMTRDGNDDAPIDPGARWNIDPCVAAPPAKWWRLTTPWNPLPRPVADDVDALAVGEDRARAPDRRSSAHRRPPRPSPRGARASAARWPSCSARRAACRPSPAALRRARAAPPRSRRSAPSSPARRRTGPALMTVAGCTVPSASKICVMPTFLPMIPVTIADPALTLLTLPGLTSA